jgi:hypothetical protein
VPVRRFEAVCSRAGKIIFQGRNTQFYSYRRQDRGALCEFVTIRYCPVTQGYFLTLAILGQGGPADLRSA